MACTFYGFTIPVGIDDADHKIANAIVSESTTGNSTRLQLLLADAVINKSAKELIDFVNDANKNNSTWKEIPQVEKLIELNGNTLKKLLRNYAIIQSKNISSYRIAHTGKELRGFTSETALEFAKEYTANSLIQEYLALQNEAELTPERLYFEFQQKVKNTWKNQVLPKFEENVRNFIAENPNETKIKEAFAAIVDTKNKLNEVRQTLFEDKKEQNKKLETLGCLLVAQYYNLIDSFDKLANNKTIAGIIQMKNYTALYKQLLSNPNEWYRQTLALSKINELSRWLEKPLQVDTFEQDSYDDEDDYINPEHDVEDETGWDKGKVQISYDKLLNKNFKIILNSIYKLNSPVEGGEVQVNQFDIKQDNALGVPEMMDGTVVYGKLLSMINNQKYLTSLETLAERIRNISSLNRDMYGLSILADLMLKDRKTGNLILSQLKLARINKVLLEFSENDIEVIPNNRALLPHIELINQFADSIQYNFKNINEFQLNNLRKLRNEISTKGARYKLVPELYDKKITETVNTIYELTKNIIPVISKDVIENFVNGAFNSSNFNSLISLIDRINDIGQNCLDEVETYLNDVSDYQAELKAYYEKINNPFLENAPDEEKPEFDYDNYMTLTGNYAKNLNNLVTLLEDYILPTPELNSVNAESNQSSNLIGNNYLTTVIDLLKSGEETEALEAFKELYKACPQIKYNPLFIGIPGTNFNGFFKEDKNGNLSINKEGLSQLNINLFDGVRSSDFSQAGTYTTLTRADYLFSQAILYFNSPKSVDSLEGAPTTTFMLDTPSDGQKNFSMSVDRLDDSDIFEIENKEELISEIISKLNDNIYKVNENNFKKELDDFKQYLNKYKRNNINIKQLYNILRGDDNFIISAKSYKLTQTDSNKNPIYDLHYTSDKGAIIKLKITGVLTDNGKYLKNIKIINIQYAAPLDGELYLSNNPSKQIINDVSVLAIQDAIKNKKAKYKVNIDSAVAIGWKSLLLGEIHNFAEQLNNVVEQKSYNDTEHSFKIRDNVEGLIANVHHKKGKIVEINDKKITFAGNFFKFDTLFDIDKFNVNELIINALSLYGGVNDSNFIVKTKDGYLLNLKNHSDIFTIDKNGRIHLNETNKKVKDYVNQIVEEWLTKFIDYTVDNLQDYSQLIEVNERRNKNKGFEDFIKFNLTTSLLRTAAQSILTGSDKFYKDSRTYLKRAKEIQANGFSHNGGNYFSKFGEEIKDLLVNDSPEIIRDVIINGKVKHLTARNGFKAVTIHNSKKPSIWKEELRSAVTKSIKEKINNGELTEEVGNNIITNIISGYSDLTTINDAQSYITFEEFVRRVYADGTYSQYEDLIDDIYAVREGKKSLSEIDIRALNARIQVRKNVYFDQQLDSKLGVLYPRFIKNAEFVIIPELLGEDSSLTELYNIMQEYGIDQINTEETSKAANRDVLTFWDNDGNANSELFKQQLNDTLGEKENSISPAIENYYYRFLYKQQEVAQHMTDEVNKAGLQVMKKILDNISTLDQNDPLVKAANSLVNNYAGNVKQSFEGFLIKMGWRLDKNGNIVNISNGSNKLNFKEFYKYAEAEARRLGMDSNFQDYFKTDINGTPLMPNYLNINASKIENVFQSLFNNHITRQKLPGWHAAQVTRVGFEGAYDSTGTKRALKYHTRDENGNHIPVVEVLISRWSNNIPKYEYTKLSDDKAEDIRLNDEARRKFDKEILKKLQDAGLDEQIGYRIPTEGKQSIAIFKIVGFVDDIYGSTIIVPDEWVTQTGSDFDVDSIYGIYHNFRYDKENKKFIKYKENTSTEEESLQRDYIKKIDELIKFSEEISIEENSHSELLSIKDKEKSIKELSDEIKKLIVSLKSDDYKNAKNKLNVLVSKLPMDLFEDYRDSLIVFNKKSIVDGKFNQKVKDDLVYDKIEQLYLAYPDDSIIKEMYETIKIIIDINNASYIIKEDITAKTAIGKQLLHEKFKIYNDLAKKYKLLTYEDYIKLSAIDRQTREVRNNNIVDSFIKILKDSRSLEENLSRSNFDDIKTVKSYLESLNSKLSKANLPVNDTLSQIIFMNDAIMGARLKARSVMRDTFLSLANRSRAILDSSLEIAIKYDLNFEYEKDKKLYDENYIRNNYDTEGTNDGLIVKHNKIGWNNNNRNIIGRLITVYGSETTAHILDAVKEGAIVNETEDTFGVFKTLLDLGVDYYTAMGFLAQPEITDLVKEFDKGNSLYFDEKPNAYKQAMLNIANDMGIKGLNIYKSIDEIFEQISKQLKLKDTSYSNYKSNLILNQKELFKTIKKGVDNDFNHRLEILVFFDKLNDINKEIEGVINLLNPDKLSAKQTIFETRRMLNNILEKGWGQRQTKIHTANNGNIIQAIYPNLLSENGIDVENSTYGSIAAMLKYSTIPSILINTQIFTFEGDGFVTNFNKLSEIYKFIKSVNNDVELDDESKRAIINKETAKLYGVVDNIEASLQMRFTPETYKQFRQYCVSECIYTIKELCSLVDVDENGLYVPSTGEEEILENANGITNNSASNPVNYWNKEIERIYGYRRPPRAVFSVEHFNAPSKEEIKAFKELTPVQKVLWLKEQSGLDVGIFNRIDVRRRYDAVTKMSDNYRKMKYNEKYDIETTYNLFRAAAFSNNPLIRLAVLDLVKYAFIVEGGQFKKGAIGKIITNDFLLANHEEGGIAFNNGESFIDNLNKEIYRLQDSVLLGNEEFVRNFIRSHKNLVYTYKATNYNDGYFKYTKKEFIDQCTLDDDSIYIPYGSQDTQYGQQCNNTISDLLTDNLNSPRSYVIISRQEKNIVREQLYKIYQINTGILLIPIGILEENEHTDYSVNDYNNPKYALQAYEDRIKQMSALAIAVNDKNELVTLDKNKLNQYKVSNFIPTTQNADLTVPKAFIQSIDNKVILDQLKKIFSSPVKGGNSTGYVSVLDQRIIKELSAKQNVIQEIELDNGNIQQFVISDRGYINDLENRELKRLIEGYKKGKIGKDNQYEEKLSKEMIDLAKYLVGFPVYNQRIYFVQSLQNLSDIENGEKIASESANDEEREFISTGRIGGEFMRTAHDKAKSINDTDRLVGRLAKSLANKRDPHDNEISRNFAIKVNMGEILVDDAESLRKMSKSIYLQAAEYYRIEAARIIEDFKHFGIDGQYRKINDDDLYEKLINNPERYDDLLELLLYAKNFGSEIGEFFKLDITTEDTEIQEAFNQIIKSIESVRNHDFLVGKNGAIVKLFDIYISKKYANNPNVRRELIKLRTQFGDINWFDSKIANIADLNNKQVQATIQAVYEILNKAKNIDAPDAREDFLRKFDEIGEVEWDKVIVDGKYVTEYNDKFLEDREKVKSDYIHARDEYGKYDIRTLEAKYRRDDFFAKNVEQPIVAKYYEEINNAVRKVLDEAPELYSKYLELRDKLMDFRYDKSGLSADAIKQMREIRYQIYQLSNANVEGMSQDEINAAKALSEYFKEVKNINDEYKEVSPFETWSVQLNKYLSIIEDYDANNPAMSLSKKLENPQYYEAYSWIQHNTIYSIDDKLMNKIREAFKTLLQNSRDDGTEPFSNYFRDNDAYDEFGKKDGTKLTLEQQIALRNAHIERLSHGEDDLGYKSGNVLIKSLGNLSTVMATPGFWDMINPYLGVSKDANLKRNEIAKKINEIYEKIDSRAKEKSAEKHKVERVLDEDGINVPILFKYASEVELELLADYYRDYRSFDSGRTDEQKQAIAAFIQANAHTEYNMEQFLKDKTYIYSEYSETSRKAQLFNDIFGRHTRYDNKEVRIDGVLQPSDEIYGKLVPNDSKYINDAATKARKFLNETVEYVTTDHYKDAEREAIQNGNYREWYEANHYYNPYLNKWVPTSIWTEMRIKETSVNADAYKYVPTFDNVNRVIRDDKDKDGNHIYINDNYKPYGVNYRIGKGEYNNTSYPVEGSKERKMIELLQETAAKYALTYGYKKFAETYAPRLRATKNNAKYWIDSALGTVGLNYKGTNSDEWHNNMGYMYDTPIKLELFEILKDKTSRKLIPIRKKLPDETDKQYHDYVEDVKRQNKEIEEANYKIDSDLRNENWRDVFSQLVVEGEMLLAREHTKNTLYLLMEDLATNPAYSVDYRNKVNIDKRNSNGAELLSWQQEMQNRTLDVLENFAHRVIYNEYKKPSSINGFSRFLQSFTSAKYMSLNVHGGIANLSTGYSNIIAEVIAGDYVSKKGLLKAERDYLINVPTFIADMYQNDASNLISAIFKLMEFVDYDEINNRLEQASTAAEASKIINDILYSFNSMGEHQMQGVVGLGIIYDSRIYKDNNGKYIIGSIVDYCRDAEFDALAKIITEYSEKYTDGKFDILTAYKNYVNKIKTDMNYANQFDDFSRDFCMEFLDLISPKINGTYNIKEEFVKVREEIIKQAEKDFEEEETLIDQFEFVPTSKGRGKARLKASSKLNYNVGKESIDDKYGNNELSRYINKIRSINSKIHGEYSKLGRASIEKYFFGNLVMQYHKHLYPGFMKRYRGAGRAIGLGIGSKGYYNESRQSIEYGSYVSLAKLLFTDFAKGMKEAISGKKQVIDETGEIKDIELTVMESLQTAAQGLVASLFHIKQNYRYMPKWEQRNVMRAVGDILYIFAAAGLVMTIYALWDDDELKNDLYKANILYTSSRMFSEVFTWTLFGLYSEGIALYDSPIAGGSSITDVFKAVNEISDLLFDENAEPIYKSGPNAGRYKLEVLATRNTPVYRIYKNILTMGKRNTYYNGGTSNLSAQKYLKDLVRGNDK